MSDMTWSGNPGSKVTKNYASVKSIVCPAAAWIGTDVCDYVYSEENTKNNLICFWDMPDGRIAHCVARSHGSGSKHGVDFMTMGAEIAFSADNGRNWTEPVPIALPDPLVTPGIENAIAGDLCLNTVLPDGNDGLLVFATLRYQNHACATMLMCRTKDFVTFTPWQRTFRQDGYHVINGDRVIRTKSGRLVIPAARHVYKDHITYGGETVFFYSDDNGLTWCECDTVGTFPGRVGKRFGLQEPGVCELNDGTLWAWARTDAGCQYQQFSEDDGKTWSAPEPSLFRSPLSPMTVKRARDGRLIAVWNPIPGMWNHKTGPDWFLRTPIVISASSDEGQTWTPYCVMDDAPEGNYCYSTIYPGEDYLLVSYYYTEPENPYNLAQSKIKYIELGQL